MWVFICIGVNEFIMEVDLQEPVVQIKRKIEQILAIPVASQVLAVSGWELLDGLYVEDYPLILTQGAKIDLSIKCIQPFLNPSTKIHIIVKFSSTQHQIEVDRTESVLSLKEKLHIINGAPIKRMSLFFCGEELKEDFCPINEYGIREFSEIIVLLKNVKSSSLREVTTTSRKLNVVVQTPSCLLNAARIPLEMTDSSTVNDLRHLLLSGKFLPMDDYLFIHKQRIMSDNFSLKWHGVEDGNTLYVFKGTVTRSTEY